MNLALKISYKAVLTTFILIAGSLFNTAHSLQAGISVDYKNYINENVIYTVPINLTKLPKIDYADLGYLIRFKPLEMLSTMELRIKENNTQKNRVINQLSSAPSVYNISFNGGKVNYQNNPQTIEDLVKKYPDRAEYIYAYAVKLSKEGKYNEAVYQADKAINLDYNYALGHFLKADILRKAGNFKAAAKEYLITLEINPYCTDAYFNIAKMLEVNGNIDLALSYYEMAYSINPNDLEIRNQILKLGKSKA